MVQRNLPCKRCYSRHFYLIKLHLCVLHCWMISDSRKNTKTPFNQNPKALEKKWVTFQETIYLHIENTTTLYIGQTNDRRSSDICSLFWLSSLQNQHISLSYFCAISSFNLLNARQNEPSNANNIYPFILSLFIRSKNNIMTFCSMWK